MHVPLGPLAGPLGRDLRAAALRDARDALVALGAQGPADRPVPEVVTEDDIAPLPPAAQRYLQYMGVVGRPRDWGFLVRLTGRFRRPGQPWMPCEAWQFDCRAPVLRVFHMRIDFARVIPMVGRDAYVDEHGEMHGRLLGLVTVARAQGPELDLGELVTYLNDALLLAPSMLLDECVTWDAVDDESFRVTLVDGPNRVTAEVFVDANGAVRDFATDDRWYDGPNGLVRARWTTPIAGWTADDEGRPWISGARAVWELPEGPRPYVDATFSPQSIVRNRWPGDILEES